MLKKHLCKHKRDAYLSFVNVLLTICYSVSCCRRNCVVNEIERIVLTFLLAIKVLILQQCIKA